MVSTKTALEIESFLKPNCDMVVIPGPFQDPIALESIYNQA
jgi:hypothetical protein